MMQTLRLGLLPLLFFVLASPASAQQPVDLQHAPTAQAVQPAAPAEPPAPEAAPRPKVVPLQVSGQTGSAKRAIRLATPSRPVELPSSAADVPVEGVLSVALNKTRPLDLPGDAVDILVGNPTVADVVVRSPRQVFLLGRAAGSTNLFFLGQDGKVVRRLEVNVGSDVESLKAALRLLLPDEPIQVMSLNDSIVLNGTVRTEGAANQARTLARRFVAGDDRVVNLMRVIGDHQVLLKVKVAEVQRTVLKELGVRLSQTTPFQIFGDLTVNNFVTAGGTANAPFGRINMRAGDVTATIDALENNGFVKTLAEPNLTAASGETARLLAGGEVPIPVSADNGVITVQYRPFGVSLAFTPVVQSSGRISLRMETEVSQRLTETVNIGNGISVPSFGVRRASSTVEMGSGGNLMMAGLLQNRDENSIDQLPALGDLPIIGALFRSAGYRREETELVITVSAFVVRPIEDTALMLPTDGFAPGTDLDLYLLGNLVQTYGNGGLQRPDGLAGPIGYIVR